MWDLSCIDWEDRIREGRSLIPDLPLLADEADMAVSFYDELQLPDVPGTPKMRSTPSFSKAATNKSDPLGMRFILADETHGARDS